MEIKISYRHIESTLAIEEKVEQKAKKLKKFFNGKMFVDWTCSVEGDVHCSDVKVSGDHFSYHVTSKDKTLYKTFDDALGKIEKQLVKHKEQTRDKLHRK